MFVCMCLGGEGNEIGMIIKGVIHHRLVIYKIGIRYPGGVVSRLPCMCQVNRYLVGCARSSWTDLHNNAYIGS